MNYKSATAFRRALTDRLNKVAKEEGINVMRLMKGIAFERFLARLFFDGSERWTLKGGYALELRLGNRARTTKDLDINIPPPPLDDLLEELQAVAELDIDDFFRFRVSQAKTKLTGPPLGGYRFHIEAILDGRVYTTFPLDVAQGDITTAEPEWVTGNVDLGFAGIERPSFAIYPLEDHFADKIHAYTTPRDNPSRVKDLVDMLLLLDLGLEPSKKLKQSIIATFKRYNRHLLPAELPKPPKSWQGIFEELAIEVGLNQIDINQGYETIQLLLFSLELID